MAKGTCKTHPDSKLVCLRCLGARGGKTTVKAHGDKLAEWGAKGRRRLQKKRAAAKLL